MDTALLNRLRDLGVRPSAFRGEAATRALMDVAAPILDADVRWAFAVEPTARPVAYESLAALARSIHRRRSGHAIQLRQQRWWPPGDREGRQVTAIYLAGEDGTNLGFLGYAWIDGRPNSLLQAALDALEPDRSGLVVDDAFLKSAAFQ